MNKHRRCQSDLIELYDDLDVVLDCRIEVNYDPGRPAPAATNSINFMDCGDSENCSQTRTILTVNGTEIEVDPETANRIFEAVEIRVKSKMKQRHEAAMLNAAIDKFDNKIFQKGA